MPATGSAARLGTAILTMAIVLAGCTSAKLTPAAGSPTLVPTATAAPTATAEPTTTTLPTETPTAAASPTPAATPGAAAACTGTAEHQAFFVEAASNLSFDLYCGALPAGWWLQSTAYTLPDGGHLDASYKNGAGAQVSIGEGNICKPPKVCASFGLDIGPASFGSIAGRLHLTESGNYMISVGPISNPSYIMSGQGLGKAQFLSIAAALVKVPKP